MNEPSPSAFAGYRFHRVLAGGAAGGTFEATETSSGEAVVIESPAGPGAASEDVREWFTWAWEALAEVDHPNLPQVRSVGLQAGVPFAVREPIDGSRLPRFLATGRSLDPASMRILICRLADGLERAHHAGVIHGALGPDDVVVDAADEGGVAGRWVGFGRAEGRRRDDVEALGLVLERMLEAEAAVHAAAVATEEPEGDGEAAGERTPTDEAILAMLTRVAARAREGGFTAAAEFRDEVAAGSQARGGARAWIKVLGLIAAAAVAAAAFLLLGGGGDEETASAPTTTSQSTSTTETTTTDATAAIDQVGEPIVLSGAPRGISVRDGVVYVATNELLGFEDPSGKPSLDPIDLGGTGGELTVVDAVAYVTLPESNQLARVDLADPGAAPEPIDVGEGPESVIGAVGSIWVVNELSGDLSRIDPSAGTAESITIGASEPTGIAFGFGSLWVSDGGGSLLRIDPENPADSQPYEVGEEPSAVLVTDERVWVANAGSGTVTGLDPATGETETVDVGGEPLDLAADPERLWVSNGRGYVSSIETGASEPARVEIPPELGAPESIAVGERVWVGAVRGNFVVPIGSAS